tara:strand:- start:234 stop:476 length:243 start_codon:yes stop_codon:yes gene_type:complete
VNEGDLVEWWFSEYVPCDEEIYFDHNKMGIIIKIEPDDGISFLREDGTIGNPTEKASVLWQDGSISWIPCIELKVINESS